MRSSPAQRSCSAAASRRRASSMLRRSASAGVVAVLLAMPGCGGVNFLRSSSEGLLSTRVCGVYIDGKTRTAHLRIELVPAARLPRNALVEVEFKNPAEGKAPLVTSRVYDGDERSLVVFSPPLTGVRPRNYEVVARIYACSEKKQVLGAHTQICQSLVDQRELTRAPRGRHVAFAGS